MLDKILLIIVIRILIIIITNYCLFVIIQTTQPRSLTLKFIHLIVTNPSPTILPILKNIKIRQICLRQSFLVTLAIPPKKNRIIIQLPVKFYLLIDILPNKVTRSCLGLIRLDNHLPFLLFHVEIPIWRGNEGRSDTAASKSLVLSVIGKDV